MQCLTCNFHFKSKGFNEDPKTVTYGTHNKATSKTSSAVYGINVYICFKILQHKFSILLFLLFPFYSHTRETVFLFFSFSGFSIFILFLCSFSFFFSPHNFLESHKPQKVQSDCARDRGGHVLKQSSWISSVFSFLQHLCL